MQILLIALMVAIGVAFLACVGIPLGIILSKTNAASTGNDTSTSTNVNNNYTTNAVTTVTTASTTVITSSTTVITSSTTVVTPSTTTGVICFSMFQPMSTVSVGSSPNSVSVADVDNNGLLDILVANNGDDSIGVLLNYGNGFFSAQIPFSTGTGSQPYSTVTADFNNDGLLDVAVANNGNSMLGIFLGSTSGIFGSQTTYSTGINSYPRWMAVADFNADGQMDIAVINWGYNSGYNLGIFLGNGGGTFSPQVTMTTGNNAFSSVSPSGVVVGDFNGDNKMDVAVTNSGADNIGILLGYGNGNFSVPQTFSTGSSSTPTFIVTSDFNHDNILDLAYCLSGTNQIGVMLGLGSGAFASQVTYISGTQPYTILAADFNLDSQLDLAVANSGSLNVGVFYEIGNGAFQPQIVDFVSSAPYAIAAGDFNLDMKPDLAVSLYYTNQIGILLGC